MSLSLIAKMAKVSRLLVVDLTEGWHDSALLVEIAAIMALQLRCGFIDS